MLPMLVIRCCHVLLTPALIAFHISISYTLLAWPPFRRRQIEPDELKPITLQHISRYAADYAMRCRDGIFRCRRYAAAAGAAGDGAMLSCHVDAFEHASLSRCSARGAMAPC
jgi:hypothetical protein